MNNIVMRAITVTTEYAALGADGEICTVEISTPPTNSGTVYFLGDDGSDVPWTAGEYHLYRSINLGALKVKGTAGDKVTVNGGTW